ncbi:nuclear transport factor 2 family protein [Naasia lichenicola]|uniref:nuclear transport factor 2 family protein n=1 Tax=Naasia lichenicola TaxID=2565933 RepID=UPI001E2BFDC7|nr:nuclear transport factor 2 family protein [Naasia lichenicola]
MSIPPAVAGFIESTNSGDVDAFLAGFTDDAVLIDWGREFRGRAGIARWNLSDNIGKQAHFELIRVDETAPGEEFEVTLTVTGNGYNGTGPMTIRVDGDRISALTISPS